MMKHTITTLFLLYWLAIPHNKLAAQDCCAANFKTTLKNTAQNLNEIDDIHHYFQGVIRDVKSDSNCPANLLAHVYRRYGWALNNKKAIKQAVSKFDTVILIKQSLGAEYVTDIDLIKAYGIGGKCYIRLSKPDKAKEYLNNAINIQHKRSYYRFIEYYYLLVAGIYHDTGDYENAIAKYKQSIKFHIDIYGEKHDYTGETWSDIGVVYTDNKNFSEASHALQNAITIAKENKNIENLIRAYNNLGNLYEAQKDYPKAEETYNIVIELCAKNAEALAEDCIKAQNNLGVTFRRLEHFQEAQDMLQQTLQAKKNYQGNVTYHYSYSATFENLADVPLAQDQHKIALDYYQKALMNLSNNFRNADISTHPTPEENPFIYSKIDLIRILDLKAKTALSFFEKNKNEQYLQLALDTYKAVDQWINLFYRDISTEKSKLEWIARAHEIYANAIHTALEAEQSERAFHFAERARAVLLWQSLSEQSARNTLTQEDREKEDNINIEIRLQETAYFDADSSEKDSLQLLIQDLNRAKEQLVKSFERKYPEYHNRKYNTDFITLKEVQNDLINDEKTALLEYFLTENLLYVFIINKNEFFVEKLSINQDFYDNIDSFNQAIKNDKSLLDEFIPPAYQLYQNVLAPALQHLNDKIEKLILIPDGRLNYVTFEALLIDTTATQNWQKLSYFINDYTVNYMYSCNSSYTAHSMKGKSQSIDFLGVAPTFHEVDGLVSLPDAEKEIQDIALPLKGHTLLGDNVTRAQFIKIAPQARTLHIASHATQGEGEGKIYLSGGEVITQKDIQAMNWAAEQVILSACETGTGELSKGEGVLSLGWSFAYKGVPSIVMSQWAVFSKSTKNLMVNYHQKLQEELPADEALRQAKLDFRNNVDRMKDAHPHHWAAFIHIGNFTKQQNKGYMPFLALCIMLGLLYRLFRGLFGF